MPENYVYLITCFLDDLPVLLCNLSDASVSAFIFPLNSHFMPACSFPDTIRPSFILAKNIAVNLFLSV